MISQTNPAGILEPTVQDPANPAGILEPSVQDPANPME